MADKENQKKRKLRLVSYNCTGLSNSEHYIRDIISESNCDFLCLQETWLQECNLSKLSLIDSRYSYHGASGMDPKAGILQGRPYGGVAVLWKNTLNSSVTPIKTEHSRVTAVKITTSNNMTLLLLSVYLPCDNQTVNVVHEDFMECLNYIEQLYTTLNVTHLLFAETLILALSVIIFTQNP
jgi:exonuclease III